MFQNFLRLEFKSLFRGSQATANLLMKIGMILMYFNFAIGLVAGAFLLYFLVKEEGSGDPLKVFASIFLIFWTADLLLKYFMLQLPANNIKPFLTMNITKSTITKYTLGKILTSFLSWGFLLFMIPFTIMLLFDEKYNVVSVLGFSLACTFLLFINTFINILINKKDNLTYIVFGVIAAVSALHYFKIIDILQVSEQIFYSFYTLPWLFIVPLLLLIVVGFLTFKYIKENLYLDKGLEMKAEVGKTENIEFLNRYGAIGTFINNDIKLIKRSKAARGALIGGFLFLFYGLLFFSGGSYESSFMQIFMGIFVTGGMNIVFGQRVPAWDSSYYPLMMTQQVPYKQYLKGKWSLSVIVIFASMIFSVFYGFIISWEFYAAIFAAGLYNLGINSYLTLLAGAYNKQPIDLNSRQKSFSGGKNNFNIKTLLLVIPQMIVPMIVFGVVNYFFGLIPAVVCIGILGLIGFFLRDKIFDMIVKIYKTEKYSTIAAFNKKD